MPAELGEIETGLKLFEGGVLSSVDPYRPDLWFADEASWNKFGVMDWKEIQRHHRRLGKQWAD